MFCGHEINCDIATLSNYRKTKIVPEHGRPEEKSTK
jgi:hypothetical protein